LLGCFSDFFRPEVGFIPRCRLLFGSSEAARAGEGASYSEYTRKVFHLRAGMVVT